MLDNKNIAVNVSQSAWLVNKSVYQIEQYVLGIDHCSTTSRKQRILAVT